MKILALSSFMMIYLSGCSLYKSEGRKEFESDTPGHVVAASIQLKSCSKQSSLETWFSEEFPAKNYELVVSEDTLEIWKSTSSVTPIEVKALQKLEAATQICTYEFANEQAWLANKDEFVRDLENNLMTSE